MHEALALRHYDQRLQQPPPTIHVRHGFAYGAVLERIAFDFSGTAPIREHIDVLAEMVAHLKADLPDFLSTHRFTSHHR